MVAIIRLDVNRVSSSIGGVKLRLLPLLISLALFCPLFAKDVPVKGYTRKDGTVVKPHTRSAPNSTKSDNYSTRGNVNPYTGKPGTVSANSSSISDAATAAARPASVPDVGTTQVEKVEYHAPQKAAASTSAPVASLLTRVTVGMTKDEVESQIGKPNIASSAAWHYSGHGWVRFKDEKVSSIEAK